MEDKWKAVITIFCVIIFCSMMTAGWWFENWKTVQMAKQGYEETTVAGRSSFVWQKVR